MTLEYNKTSHQKYIFHFEQINEIFQEVLTELRDLKITDKLNYKDLETGDFIGISDNFHMQYHANNYKDFIYSKYIENCGLDTTKLLQLENRYKNILNAEYKFYDSNNSYWSFVSSRKHDFKYSNILKTMPKLMVYKSSDFVKITSTKVAVNLPEKYFTLSTTNNKQVELIDNIKKYVELSKSLNIDYKLVKDAVGKYINNITREYVIEFNYNEILTVI